MTPIRRSWSLTILVVLVGILAACTPTDPGSRAWPQRRPPPRRPVPDAERRRRSIAAIGPAHVSCVVATPNDVTVDVTDASRP